MNDSATILIAARNAAATIERSVLSACAQGDSRIILIDDFSNDDTVSIAQHAAGRRLKIIQPPEHRTLGLTRQTGLEAVETPFGMWLDADDELLPGRLDRMIEALKIRNADLASDEAELWSGPYSEFVMRLQIPSFLKNHHPLSRLFERNYLPAPGAIGFRTRFAQKIGYDARLHGAEDYDFLLRAVVAGSKIALLDDAGYRLFAYPQSLSRSAENQRSMCRRALEKHSYEKVRALYVEAGYDDCIALWGIVSVAMFRADYLAVLQFLKEVDDLMIDPEAVLEPEGPYAYPESWKIGFFRGTALLLMGNPAQALPILEHLQEQIATAAGCNNLGVAKWQTGDNAGASILFKKSLELFPGYFDAKSNLESSSPSNITTHPLRTEPARADYSSI
jgi:glycosyltransferase involved in cell wall biosynthesis